MISVADPDQWNKIKLQYKSYKTKKLKELKGENLKYPLQRSYLRSAVLRIRII